jgi:hypothetical protein
LLHMIVYIHIFQPQKPVLNNFVRFKNCTPESWWIQAFFLFFEICQYLCTFISDLDSEFTHSWDTDPFVNSSWK